jgi:hypothetical protein
MNTGDKTKQQKKKKKKKKGASQVKFGQRSQVW